MLVQEVTQNERNTVKTAMLVQWTDGREDLKLADICQEDRNLHGQSRSDKNVTALIIDNNK